MTTRLTLFLSGGEPESRRLTANLKSWCQRQLGDNYRLDVLDIRRVTKQTASMPILATPALTLAATNRMVVGDLSDVPRTMAALGLA